MPKKNGEPTVAEARIMDKVRKLGGGGRADE